MTTIASNAALSILSQPTPRLVAPAGADPARSATDTILAIVSAAAKGSVAKTTSAPAPAPAAPATTEPSATPRAVGGSVSSEPSKAQLGAMAAAGSMTTTYDPIAAANGFLPIKASVENAEAFIRGTSYAIDQYNRGLEPDRRVPTREEYFAEVAAWGAKRLANGEDAEKVKQDLAHYGTAEKYELARDQAKVSNYFRHREAEDGYEHLIAGQERIAEVFGAKLPISFDEHGRASIGNFELRYGNGNLMLHYDPKAGLQTYNEDGSLRSTYAKDKVSNL